MPTAGTIDVKVMKVTPKKAQEWLEQNEVNRNIRPKLVSAYRRDMEAGRWVFTAEPIQISRTGRLLNGQHRLSALSSSTKVKHIELVVATGLPDTTQAMMDQGKPRNARDALMIAHGHVKNSTIVASILRWLVLAPEPGAHLTPSLMRTKVTTAEALAAFEQFPDVVEAAERATYMRNVLLGSPSAVGYTWHALHRVDAEACTEFFAGMADMEWAWKNDPRKAALRRMQALHRDQEVKTSIETG
ncbi:MAG TPA: hypothetical protein VK204_14490, partial [Nocardioidaceae bacterium]|nr:hypothetical protein [Nocardioidaceae bacterium]